ncbi:MAG TPA: hypothetical protein VMS88_08665 [Terriglobales bacterium]|nr:hypothetical protein [Terriglobales bacterium]
MPSRVLLVEENPDRLDSIAGGLAADFECSRAASVEQAVGRLTDGSWAAVVANVDLGGTGSGSEVLQIVRESCPRAFRILYVADLEDHARHDLQRICRPHVIVDASRPDLVELLHRALEDLLGPACEPEAGGDPDTYGSWTAYAPITREFLAKLREAAEQHGPVYLYGENGSGRMCAARIMCRWRTRWITSGRSGRMTVRATVPALRVPSLRERLQDLPEIALRALKKLAERDGVPMRRLSTEALDELRSREWRGNIDELATVLERAAQRAGGRPVIEATDLPRATEPRWRPSQYAKDEGQRDCLLRQLRSARTVSAAARLEGCTRANYIRLMRRLGILRGDIVEQRPDLDRDAIADRVLA